MAVNWHANMMRWKPYVDANGRAYPLNHLHPLRYNVVISDGRSIEIRVAFAMHCFTRSCTPNDDPSQHYKDKRETRTFCPDRYLFSKQLPTIAQELSARKCGYAKADNYVTIDVAGAEGVAMQYGVFFNTLRVKDGEGLAVLLTIQSAYELAPAKQSPINGSIKFLRLIELTMQGIKPRPPRR